MVKKNNTSQRKLTAASTRFGKQPAITDTRTSPKMEIDYFRFYESLLRKEVADWQEARATRRDPFHPLTYPIQQLYKDAMLDNHLQGAVENRILRILNKEFVIRDLDGNIDVERSRFVQMRWFRHIVRRAMESKFYGYSMMLINDFAPGQIRSLIDIPRENIIPEQHLLLKNAMISNGERINFADYPNFFIYIQLLPDAFGILERVAPLTIYKRHSWAAWDEFEQIFGVPIRIARTIINSKKHRDELQQWLRSMGTMSYAILDKSTDIEIKENQKTDAFNVFYQKIQAINKEISKGIIGQTMTMDDGSSQSQAEVHQKTYEEITAADVMDIQDWASDSFFNVMRSFGYDIPDGYYLELLDRQVVRPEDKIKIDRELLLAGYTIDPQYIEDFYGTPLLDNVDNGTSPDDDDDDDDDPDRQASFFADAPATTGAFSNSTPTLTAATTLDINVARLFNDALQNIFRRAENNDRQPWIERNLFDITNNTLQDGINTAFGVEFGKRNEAFVNQFRYNTAVFSAFKNHLQTQEIVNLLRDEKGDLRSFANFRREAMKISRDYNVNWLRTEYTTAVRAARSAVNWKKYEEAADLYPNLEYVRSSASEPRSQHLAWVGTIRPINDPWWDSHMPPSDWNCQCSVRQTDARKTPVPDDSANHDPVFRNNPGKSAQFVRLDQHPYVKSQCPYVGNCDRQSLQAEYRPVRPECQNCALAKAYARQQERIEANRQEYDRLKNNPDYTDKYADMLRFNPKTGALTAVHNKHNFDPQPSKIAGYKTKGDYEKAAIEVLYQYGRKIIMASESAANGIRTPDGHLDDMVFDIKAIEGTGKNNIKHKFQEAYNQQAEHVVLFYPSESLFDLDRIAIGYKMYLGQLKKTNPIKFISYIVNGKLYRYK